MQQNHYETLHRIEAGHWWYRTRRAIVHDIINANFEKPSNLQLADIGCGTGTLTKELEQYGTCLGIDTAQKAIDYCNTRGVVNLRLGSAEATGCPTNSMDVVLCLDVLEHLDDDMLGIEEIKRILKPNGIGIIFVPAFMFLWGVTDELGQHRRRYRLPEIADKFTDAQFTIQKKSYFNTLLFPLIALVRVSVRLLRISIKSEAETGTGIVNALLYRVFTFERILLRHMQFPFGVSIMLVVKK